MDASSPFRPPIKRCPCRICNAPDNEPCFDCGKDLTDEKDIFEDRAGNPVCQVCWEKRLMAAEAYFEKDR